MQIEVRYCSDNNLGKKEYHIEIRLVGLNDGYSFNYNNIPRDENNWININDLMPDKISEYGIKQLLIETTKEIIPVGIIDFKTGGYNEKLYMKITDESDLYKVEPVINSISKAIEFKYKCLELKTKFIKDTIEHIII